MPSTVFDRLKERVADQRREEAQQWYAQQPRQPPVMPPPVIIRSQLQPTPQQPEQPVAEMGQPIHRTHKPLLVAFISIAVIGAIVSLLLWGPQFVGQAIAGAPQLTAGMAGTYFAEPPQVGQVAQVMVGMYPSGPSHGIEIPLIHTEQLQPADANNDGALTAADLSPGVELNGWMIDADYSQPGVVIIRGYHPQLQAIEGPIQIGVPFQVNAIGGRATIDGIKMGHPDALITTVESRAVVEEAPAAGEAPKRVARRRTSRTLPSQPPLPGQAQVGGGRGVGNKVPSGWSPKDYAEFTGKSLQQLAREGKEICGDGFDNDNDGQQDCADLNDCQLYPKCLVGDDDGDGVPNDIDKCVGSLAEDVQKDLIGEDGCPRGAGGDTCINEQDVNAMLANMLPNAECSTDADGDGIADAQDDDVDGDGQANAQDTDDDNDGVLDEADLCAFTFKGLRVTTDGCLYGDVWDSTKVESGRDNCVNGDDLDFIRQKFTAGLAC